MHIPDINTTTAVEDLPKTSAAFMAKPISRMTSPYQKSFADKDWKKLNHYAKTSVMTEVRKQSLRKAPEVGNVEFWGKLSKF